MSDNNPITSPFVCPQGVRINTSVHPLPGGGSHVVIVCSDCGPPDRLIDALAEYQRLTPSVSVSAITAEASSGYMGCGRNVFASGSGGDSHGVASLIAQQVSGLIKR